MEAPLPLPELIRAFESGTLRESQFRHREHLLVCLWYLDRYPEMEAILRIKFGIMKYNLLFAAPQAGERGYHETITMFFIQLAQNFLRHGEGNVPFEEKASAFLAAYPDFRPLLESHYRRETVRSDHARKFWREPDLKPLPSTPP